MIIIEEEVCEVCKEINICRPAVRGGKPMSVCVECIAHEQERAQAALDAQFDCMAYRLPPQDEQFLAGIVR